MERSVLESTVNRLVQRWAPVLLPGWVITIAFATNEEIQERMHNREGLFSAMSYSDEGEMREHILVNAELDWDDPRHSLKQVVLHELVHSLLTRADAEATRTLEHIAESYPQDYSVHMLQSVWHDVLEYTCDRVGAAIAHTERS